MIIIALFVIVVMGLLAANLVRIRSSNQDTLARETLGTQAWFLAHSANEWALTQLYPLGGSGTLAELAVGCSTINSSSTSAAADLADGLPCESPVIVCEAPSGLLPDDLKYYRVASSVICSSGSIFQVQREQEVWIRAIGE